MSPFPTFLAHPERKNVARIKNVNTFDVYRRSFFYFFFGVITAVIFLPARRYASGGTSYDPVSVSVTSRCSIETDGWNNLVFGMGASFDQSNTVF